MIAKLIKELMQVLWRYAAFRVTGPQGGPRDGELATPIGTPLDILDRLVHQPKFILDLGCGSGDFATSVMERFPRAPSLRIEPNEKPLCCSAQLRVAAGGI